MTRPRLTRRIQDSRVQRQVGEFPVSAGTGREARFGDPTLMERAGTRAQLGAFEGEGRNVTQGPFIPFIADFLGEEDDGRERLSTEELNRRFGDLGLKFDHPLTEQAAELLAENRRAELIRQSIIRREPGGLGTKGLGFGVDLVNMAMDPLEIASAFVPAVSAAKHAAWIARHGSVVGRARVGVVEGFAGNLMMEPAYMALSDQLQMDYGMADGIANVFLGSVLGGAIGGGVGAAMRGRRRLTLTEDMRVRQGEAAEVDLGALDVGGALNLSREQRALLPTPAEGRSGLRLRPAEPELPPRVAELEDIIRRRELSKEATQKQADETRRKLERVKNAGARTKLERKLGRLNFTIEQIDVDNAAARAEVQRLRDEAGVGRMELTDAEGNVIPLDPDQQSALAAAINGPSAAQRGQALKGAIAQMAQGKSVRVAETAEEVSRLKNKERLARGRITQIRNALERARAEGDAERVSDLEGRLARAEDQHRLAKAEIEAGQAATAGRVAQEEQQLDRSAMYEPEKVTELEEKAKRTDIPDETEVDQEISDLQALLKQKVEAGEMDEDALQSLVDELEQLDGSVEAFGRATEYMKLCLRR